MGWVLDIGGAGEVMLSGGKGPPPSPGRERGHIIRPEKWSGKRHTDRERRKRVNKRKRRENAGRGGGKLEQGNTGDVRWGYGGVRGGERGKGRGRRYLFHSYLHLPFFVAKRGEKGPNPFSVPRGGANFYLGGD